MAERMGMVLAARCADFEAPDMLFTPTLTGFGERSRLLGPRADLAMHIADIVNVLVYEDLSQVSKKWIPSSKRAAHNALNWRNAWRGMPRRIPK
jgi:hypothetical protein